MDDKQYTLVLIPSQHSFMGVLEHDQIEQLVANASLIDDPLILSGTLRGLLDIGDVLIRGIKEGEDLGCGDEIAAYPGWRSINAILPLTCWSKPFRNEILFKILMSAMKAPREDRPSWYLDVRYADHWCFRPMTGSPWLHWSACVSLVGDERIWGAAMDLIEVCQGLRSQRIHEIDTAPSRVSRDLGRGRDWRDFFQIHPGAFMRTWIDDTAGTIRPHLYDRSYEWSFRRDPLFDAADVTEEAEIAMLEGLIEFADQRV